MQLPGVHAVTLNRVCGTLRVDYDGGKVSAPELGRCWRLGATDTRSATRCAERAVDTLSWGPLLARIGRALFAHFRC